MDNAQVQSIVARCLTEPEFLDSVSADPDTALAAYALEEPVREAFREFDFQRLRNLAGFIAKVQHNYLWEFFPGTLTVLKLTGVQIPVFSSYNVIHQRLRATENVPREEKIRSFLSYLRAELAARSAEPGIQALLDVLAHEEISWRLSRNLLAKQASDEPSCGWDASADEWQATVPSVRGTLEVREFHFDPVVLLAELEHGVMDLSGLKANPQTFGYWGDPKARSVRILLLDKETGVLLSAIDGSRTIGTVIEQTAAVLGAGIDPEAYRVFFEEAFHSGLLVPSSAPSARS